MSKYAAKALPDKRASIKDFKERISINFPSKGSTTTPAHPNRDFKFVDYAPTIFHRLRNLFGIKSEDYLVKKNPLFLLACFKHCSLFKLSLTADYRLSEIISPGKSKSFFYFSYDMNFMLKTINLEEKHFLKKILPYYYEVFFCFSSFFLMRHIFIRVVKSMFTRTLTHSSSSFWASTLSNQTRVRREHSW